MQALILPLCQAPQHPRVVGKVLQILRVVLPENQLYLTALTRHAFTQAILLTALPPLRPASEGREVDVDGFALLGLHAGICSDAAALLADTDLVEFDENSCGWLELASAPPRVAARLLVDASDSFEPAVRSPSAPERSNLKAFKWTVQDSKAAAHAGTVSSLLAPFIPPALIRILHESGPEAFARVFNSSEYESPTCLWSRSLRNRLLISLKSQVGHLRAWVTEGTDLACRDLHPCAAVDSHAQMRATAAGVKTIAQLRGLVQPFPAITICSASQLLCVPPVVHTPVPAYVSYPELDKEPRVGGIYLRVYVKGHSLPPGDSSLFLKALIESLHREVSAVLAARFACARQIANGRLAATGKDALSSYEISHSRALLSLQVR